MKSFKIHYLTTIGVCLLWAVCLFTSCDEKSPIDEPTDSPATNGFYFLSSGNYAGNDAGLDFYDAVEEKLYKNVFKTKNNRNLGDTGNDMIVYGSKLYIAVAGSKTVEVTEPDGTSIKQLSFEGDPRYLVAHGGKIYVSLFNGYVARLDTASLSVEKTVQVGRNPEQIVAANGKLYVANSGGLDYASPIGYDKTVSVIDVANFTEIKKIEVVINPSCIAADKDGDVYVASMGNYQDIAPVFQRIDKNDNVTVVKDVLVSDMAATGEFIYILSPQSDIIVYNALQESVQSVNFVSDPAAIPSKPYKICVDAVNGYVFISSSDYVNNGDYYLFDLTGKKLHQWEVGLNPIKAVAVK